MTNVTEPSLVTSMYADQGRLPRRFWAARVVNQIDDVGRTTLHYFAGGLTNDDGDYYDDGRTENITRWLVGLQAGVNVADVGGKTPLHYLVDRGRCCPAPERNDVVAAVRVLLESGANPNVADACGLTAYARAAVYGDRELMSLMTSLAGVDFGVVCPHDFPETEVPGVHEPLLEPGRDEWRVVPIKGKTVAQLRDEVTRGERKVSF